MNPFGELSGEMELDRTCEGDEVLVQREFPPKELEAGRAIEKGEPADEMGVLQIKGLDEKRGVDREVTRQDGSLENRGCLVVKVLVG